MIEAFVLGAMGLMIAAVLGIIGAAVSLVFWLIALPFKLLAWGFKGLGLLLALPFILLFGLVGLLIGGLGLFVLVIPVLPLLLLALLVWVLIKGTFSLATGH